MGQDVLNKLKGGCSVGFVAFEGCSEHGMTPFHVLPQSGFNMFFAQADGSEIKASHAVIRSSLSGSDWKVPGDAHMQGGSSVGC